MRQADVIDKVRELILGASIDASPENYEICYKFVTQSDEAVCAAFRDALGNARKIDATAFGKVRIKAGPSGRAAQLDDQTAQLEQQLAAVMTATRDASGHSASYSRSLSADADKLESLGGGADIAGIVANLLVRTKAMAQHSQSLEASLVTAGSELSRLRAQLEKAKRESDTDPLTSLPNRRAFDCRLGEAIAEAAAARTPLSLAFFDIDHFKAFNDSWGHQIGDHVLRFVGAHMAAQCKEIGVAARYGGEEFVLMLPGYGSVDALQAVTTLCNSVSARTLRARSDGQAIGRVTLSAGVATLRRGEGAGDLVARADAAMYAAKQAGRNRVLSA